MMEDTAKYWFSAAELADAKLPGMPETARGVLIKAQAEKWQSRPRTASGGGNEYPLSALPIVAQSTLALREARAPEPTVGRGEWLDRQTDAKKAKARRKLEALQAVDALVLSGQTKVLSMQLVARQVGVTLSTLYNWEAAIRLENRGDWMALLAPRHRGGGCEAACDEEAWDVLRADWLRLERPTFSACYRRLQAVAAERGWTVPAARTLERRLDALAPAVVVLARDGIDRLKAMYPAQRRDRSVFHALEAVNADGHKWDVFVKWPDGTVGRPLMVAFQDLYSGKFLSWRVDRSENKECVRLAFGDMVENFGIPSYCYLDNGRSFASKWLTAGVKNRFRFKIKDEDPVGIFTQLGVEIHWTTPYAGQSKPIERAFGDFARGLAKHPAFAGAYTGNNPMAKPENYGAASVPIETFIQVIGEGIAQHNARVGRRATVCNGRSFDETFNESYAKSVIRKAAPESRRLWLLAAENVLVGKRDGAIDLMGNRYWSEMLHAHMGDRVVIRFDPEALTDDLHVYRLDGAYLGAAPCVAAVGFNDVGKAREHNQARKAWMRGKKDMAAAERKMTIDQVAAMLPTIEAPAAPETKVVRLLTSGNAALKARHEAEPAHDLDQMFINATHRLRLVQGDDDLP
jgi:putative transposase